MWSKIRPHVFCFIESISLAIKSLRLSILNLRIKLLHSSDKHYSCKRYREYIGYGECKHYAVDTEEDRKD